jgi:short-subunit dehydrogenase
VVFISSVAGLRTYARCSVYGATKWAVQGIAGSLREECKGSRVKIATLCPGSVASPWSSSVSILCVCLCLFVSVVVYLSVPVSISISDSDVSLPLCPHLSWPLRLLGLNARAHTPHTQVDGAREGW